MSLVQYDSMRQQGAFMNEEPEYVTPDDADSGGRPSWPYPSILFLYVLIFQGLMKNAVKRYVMR